MLSIFHKILLNYEQRQVNKLYNSEGLSKRVLNKQIKINGKRNELNLPDKHELFDNGFVQ